MKRSPRYRRLTTDTGRTHDHTDTAVRYVFARRRNGWPTN